MRAAKSLWRCPVSKRHYLSSVSQSHLTHNKRQSLTVLQHRFNSVRSETFFELTPEEAAYYDSRDKMAATAHRRTFTLDEDYKEGGKDESEESKSPLASPIGEVKKQKKIALSLDFANVCYDYLGVGSLRQAYFEKHCRNNRLNKWEIDSKGRVEWVLETEEDEKQGGASAEGSSEEGSTSAAKEDATASPPSSSSVTPLKKKSFFATLFGGSSKRKPDRVPAKHTHILGSFSIKDSSWQWIWANPQSETPAKLMQHSLLIHDTLNQFAPEFGTGCIETSPIWMGDIMSRISLAKLPSDFCGYLRVPMGKHLRVYILVEYEPSPEERIEWEQIRRVLRPNSDADDIDDGSTTMDPIRDSSPGLSGLMRHTFNPMHTRKVLLDHELNQARSEAELDSIVNEETGLRYSTLLLSQTLETVLSCSMIGPALLDHKRLLKHFLRHMKAEFKELTINNGILLGRKNGPVKIEFSETGLYSTFYAKGLTDQQPPEPMGGGLPPSPPRS